MALVNYDCTNLSPVLGILLGPPLALAEEHAHGGGDVRPRLIQVCSNTMPEEGRRMVGCVGSRHGRHYDQLYRFLKFSPSNVFNNKHFTLQWGLL